MKVLLNKDNVVIAKGEDMKPVINGVYIPQTNTIYAEGGLTIIETNLDPEVLKHKIVGGVIVNNPDYLTPEQEEELYKLTGQPRLH
jgi:translation initiation factor 2 gamma subunit (eIF-2gamma)